MTTESSAISNDGNTHQRQPSQLKVGATSERQAKTPEPPLSSSRGLMTLSIAATVLLALVSGVYVYTSKAAKDSSSPTPISEELYRQASVPVAQPVSETIETPLAEVVEPVFTPNATIDVPSVGLRNAPAFNASAKSGSIKRGERVEIVGRNSSQGPDWVKIKTRNGKTGWVFASVVKEQKNRQ